ncbi:MAG: sugar ABC transporter ATP-binding protein [Gaiellaceae bacterium]
MDAPNTSSQVSPAAATSSAVATRQAPLVAMRGVSKAFYGSPVLASVDFDLEPGEVHALVGGNGAGKSTLMKILEGVYSLDSGQIEIAGEPVRFHSGVDAQRHGIAMIFQEFSLIPTLTVAQNVFLAREVRGALGTVNDRACEQQTRQLFADIGVSVDPKARMDSLPTAYWQLAEIAKALAQNARVLIMDEPTASLAGQETQALFVLIRRLKERGIGIIYISHRLEEVLEIADRVTVLRDGRIVSTEPAASLTIPRVIELVVGRKVSGAMEWQRRDVSRDVAPLLEVSDLVAGPRVRGITFQVHAGEIVGLAGLMGSGRTELARALFGISRIESGHVRVRGREIKIRSTRDAIAAGFALVPEDRRREGLVLDHTVRANITLTLLQVLAEHGVLRRRREQALAEELGRRLEVVGGSLANPVRLLSGGNQQKVVIAKWLGRDPDILLMDEPTSGIDVGTKAEIIDAIKRLADAGKAVIMISSEVVDLLAAADRILVIHDGVIEGSYLREKIANEKALHALIQEV